MCELESVSVSVFVCECVCLCVCFCVFVYFGHLSNTQGDGATGSSILGVVFF